MQDPSTGLCSRHAAHNDADPDTTDISADLFGANPKPLETPDEVNDLLSRLVLLVAQGRISTRRASVISYSSSLILYGLMVYDLYSRSLTLNMGHDQLPVNSPCCSREPRSTISCSSEETSYGDC